VLRVLNQANIHSPEDLIKTPIDQVATATSTPSARASV